MTILRLAGTELRRLTAGKLPKMAIFALLIVPLMYGSMYLYANWNPTGHMNKVPTAIVNLDAGANGTNVGKQVSDQLVSDGSFKWSTASQADAETGVNNGTYTFALVLPQGFTESLNSAATTAPQQGVITLMTNDANNYLVRASIAPKVLEAVHSSVAKQVSTKAADQLLLGYSTIHGKITEAATGATKLSDGASTLNSSAQTLATGADQLNAGVQKLSSGSSELVAGENTLTSGLQTLQSKTASLPSQANQLNDGAQQLAAGLVKLATGAHQVTDGDQQIAAIGQKVATASEQFVGSLDSVRSQIKAQLENASTLLGEKLSEEQINQILAILDTARSPIDQVNNKIQSTSNQLTTLSNGASQVASGADQLTAGAQKLAAGTSQLAASAPALTNGISDAATGSAKLQAGAAQLQSGLASATTGTTQLATGAHKLHDEGTTQIASGSQELSSGLNTGLSQIPNYSNDESSKKATVIGDPVNTQTVGDVQASTYGAGLAPFFLGLAAWVGIFALFLLIKPLSKRALAAGASAHKIALGGWLPTAVLGAAQAILLYAVVTLLVGVHSAHPVLTLLFMMFTSVTFAAVLHGLNAYFGAVGKFLGLVLLVLQLVSAGGTFPWQSLPAPLIPLHHALPMGYVVDGMRHLIYGGQLTAVGTDVVVLAAWLVVGLALAIVAAHKQKTWTLTKLKPELVM